MHPGALVVKLVTVRGKPTGDVLLVVKPSFGSLQAVAFTLQLPASGPGVAENAAEESAISKPRTAAPRRAIPDNMV
jgi:hypothetical protein